MLEPKENTMFKTNHFIWLAICAVLIVGPVLYMRKRKPSLKDVLTACCIVCVVSEIIKVFGTIEIVPSADGTMYYPYLETNHIPLHLCSLQIITIFLCRFMKEGKKREIVLAFLSTTAPLGAAFALALPSVLGSTVPLGHEFFHPIAYQTFLYHTMLITLGIYIQMSGEVHYETKYYWYTLGILGALFFCSIYINSLFGHAVYNADTLVSVEHTTNFLFSYLTPIGLVLKKKWHWFIYLAIIFSLAFSLIALFYIPVFIRSAKEKKALKAKAK